MKKVIIITLALVVFFAALRFLTAYDPFMIKVFGVVMAVFGGIVIFAFGSMLEELSEGALEVGGSLLASGIIVILFI